MNIWFILLQSKYRVHTKCFKANSDLSHTSANPEYLQGNQWILFWSKRPPQQHGLETFFRTQFCLFHVLIAENNAHLSKSNWKRGEKNLANVNRTNLFQRSGAISVLQFLVAQHEILQRGLMFRLRKPALPESQSFASVMENRPKMSSSFWRFWPRNFSSKTTFHKHGATP